MDKIHAMDKRNGIDTLVGIWRRSGAEFEFGGVTGT